MPFLHPNQPLKVATLDGINSDALEPLPFRLRSGRLLRARTAASSDGLSSPKWSKCYLQSGNTYFPARAHDAGYRGDLEESLDNGATWQPEFLSKPECDAMLLELCEDNQVPPDEAEMIAEAVIEFGQSAWDGDALMRATPKTELTK